MTNNYPVKNVKSATVEKPWSKDWFLGFPGKIVEFFSFSVSLSIKDGQKHLSLPTLQGCCKDKFKNKESSSQKGKGTLTARVVTIKLSSHFPSQESKRSTWKWSFPSTMGAFYFPEGVILFTSRHHWIGPITAVVLPYLKFCNTHTTDPLLEECTALQ